MFVIDREYKQGEMRNRNELPFALLSKIILYSSDPEDTVCDMFLGGGSTAIVAKGLGRIPMGFEMNTDAFRMAMDRIGQVKDGSMLDKIRTPQENRMIYSGKAWTDEERTAMVNIINDSVGLSKKEVISRICEYLKRGRFGVQNELDRMGIEIEPSHQSTMDRNRNDPFQTTLF